MLLKLPFFPQEKEKKRKEGHVWVHKIAVFHLSNKMNCLQNMDELSPEHDPFKIKKECFEQYV